MKRTQIFVLVPRLDDMSRQKPMVLETIYGEANIAELRTKVVFYQEQTRLSVMIRVTEEIFL